MLSRSVIAALIGAFLSVGTAHAEKVEVYLTDMLDNTQHGYCLDIARAQGAQANPDDGLQGHTCYSPLGELMVDQIFDTDKFADGLLYMPEFNVCAMAASVTADSPIELAACDGSAAQSFVFSGNGTITPSAAPDMCVTVATDTRSGRSDTNQIKALSLQPCDTTRAAYQTWSTRSSS
jgi:hypothetical protein